MQREKKVRHKPVARPIPYPNRRTWKNPQYPNTYRHIEDPVLRFTYQQEDQSGQPDYLEELSHLGFKRLPRVAMAIPARESGTHIPGLLESLYGIQYPNLRFVICLEEGDTTADAIHAYFDEHSELDQSLLTIVWVKTIADYYGRNANRLRNALARFLAGLDPETPDIELELEHFVRPTGIPNLENRLVDVVGWTDTKIRHPRNLVASAVYHMLTMFEADTEVDYSTFTSCVTGVMKAMPEQTDAAAVYQDKGALKRGQNAPWNGEYLTWKTQFWRQRWPITAVWFETIYFTFRRGLFHPNFRDSYEDYEAVIEALERRLTIVALGKLIVYHKHRTSPEAMWKQDLRSGFGAGQMVFVHRSSPFAIIRFLIVILIAGGTLFAALGMSYLFLSGHYTLFAFFMSVGVMFVVGLGLLNVYSSKSWRGFLYLRFTLSSIYVYMFGFLLKLSQRGKIPKSNRWLQTSIFIPPIFP